MILCGQVIARALGAAGSNPLYVFGYKGWGYTLAEISAQSFPLKSYGVDGIKVALVDTCTGQL